MKANKIDVKPNPNELDNSYHYDDFDEKHETKSKFYQSILHEQRVFWNSLTDEQRQEFKDVIEQANNNYYLYENYYLQEKNNEKQYH